MTKRPERDILILEKLNTMMVVRSERDPIKNSLNTRLWFTMTGRRI